METAVAWAGRSGGAEPGGGARDIASLEKVARPQISCLVARRILNSFGQRLGGAQGIPPSLAGVWGFARSLREKPREVKGLV